MGQQLFSSSADRSIKTYSFSSEDSLAYTETLYGHSDNVQALSAMSRDQCVSVGRRDRTARLWKVSEEEQLKFLGDSSAKDTYHTSSLDCVAALPPQHFVTGSDSGAITLWSMHRKKPVFTITTAHGVDQPQKFEEVTSEADARVIEELKRLDTRRPIPRAVTALVALPGTDIVLSGSWDGWIRVWQVSEDKRSLISLGSVGSASGNKEEDRVSLVNGDEESPATGGESRPPNQQIQRHIRGIINSLDVFERRQELRDAFGGKKEGDTQGLCIVAGIGKEWRLGRHMRTSKGRNGAMVFEVPLIPSL